MGERKRRSATERMRAVPYPAPKSDRCQQLMLAVIKGLGKLPSNDDEIEDRVLACVLVAWGELATMQDGIRRDEIIGSLGGLGDRVVRKILAVNVESNEKAESAGQTLAEMLYEAVGKGEAEEVPLTRPRASQARGSRKDR
jgi:hypothetical protein